MLTVLAAVLSLSMYIFPVVDGVIVIPKAVLFLIVMAFPAFPAEAAGIVNVPAEAPL